MGVLQALCGLRVLEAAAVRRQDIDFTRGTVTVTETPIHKPKTTTSYRTVPICREAIDALSTLIREQAVIPHSGEIFLSPQGATWSKNALCKRWKRFLPMAAEKVRISRIKEIPAHRLRSSFATMAARLGVEDRVLKTYLGHAPTDILGAHYRRISGMDLWSVSNRMNEWRNLPDSDQEWQDRGNIEKEGSVTG